MVDNRTVLKPSTTPFWGPTAGLVAVRLLSTESTHSG